MIRFASIFFLCGLLAACATKPLASPSLPPPPSLPAPPLAAPDIVTGLSAAALRTAFGAPALVRKDGIAEMWRYDGALCHAFFFLYDEQGIKIVRQVETVPTQGTNTAADAACLNALRVPPKSS
jgi:hypothetical protein